MLNHFDDLCSFRANRLNKRQGRARLHSVLVVEPVEHLRLGILKERDHPDIDLILPGGERPYWVEEHSVPASGYGRDQYLGSTPPASA